MVEACTFIVAVGRLNSVISLILLAIDAFPLYMKHQKLEGKTASLSFGNEVIQIP